MRVAIVALILMIGVVVLLAFGDTLKSFGVGLNGVQAVLIFLLFSIPISLVLFAFLSHRENDQLKAKAIEEGFRKVKNSVERR